MHIGYIGETRRQQTDADGAIPREVEHTAQYRVALTP